MKIKKIILILGISLFIVSCGGDSSADNRWPKSIKTEMLADCVADGNMSEESCKCVVNETTSAFTYDEFQKLENSNPDDATANEEMQERAVSLMMALMECSL